jgi:hypothetical protein
MGPFLLRNLTLRRPATPEFRNGAGFWILIRCVTRKTVTIAISPNRAENEHDTIPAREQPSSIGMTPVLNRNNTRAERVQTRNSESQQNSSRGYDG